MLSVHSGNTIFIIHILLIYERKGCLQILKFTLLNHLGVIKNILMFNFEVINLQKANVNYSL